MLTMSLSTLDSLFLFISIELCHEALMVFVNPSSLFSSSNKITLHTHACFSKFFAFLTQQNHSPYTCMFLQVLCFPHPTKSLSIHMHVSPSSLLCSPNKVTLHTHAYSSKLLVFLIH
jgi:hypothetical protein